MNDLDVGPTVRKARVEIIPLIDVIFFLLATFVLFTLSLDKLRVLEGNLPKGQMGDHGPDETTLFIQASSPGNYFWKVGESGTTELVADVELRGKLVEYRGRVAAPRVFIRSDNKAKFGDAVRVLDEVRSAKIEQVAIETMVSKPGM